MQVLSKATIYGLRALLYIVSREDWNRYTSIREISDALDISFHFLTKIFQSLTQNGILESYRGPNGGVILKTPPERVFLIDIVKILEGEDFFDQCILGLPGCGEEKPCPMHDFWKVTKAALKTEFESTSLAELGGKVQQGTFRLVARPPG